MDDWVGIGVMAVVVVVVGMLVVLFEVLMTGGREVVVDVELILHRKCVDFGP